MAGEFSPVRRALGEPARPVVPDRIEWYKTRARQSHNLEDARSASSQAGPAAHRVLFIGNSLTYFNDLPGTVAQLAASVNETVEVASVARPNFALIDHVSRELGTYLAALVVYEGITGHDVRSLPAEATVAGRKLRVPPGRVRLLQRAAHGAVARFNGD